MLPLTTTSLKTRKGVNEEPILSWVADEYPYREQGIEWYAILAVIFISLIGGAIFFSNYLLAALITVTAFALFVQSFRAPQKVRFELSSEGVSIGKEFFAYETLTSFWVAKGNGEHPKLIIDAKRLLLPHFVIPLGDTDTESVREYLGAYLEESDEEHEPFSHAIMEKLGF
ncbi:MAG: hypothetical protein HY457_01185 [Parcubacteria group bacterium]|nr:hypothetical protein [Parcubacteria group bacterium]